MPTKSASKQTTPEELVWIITEKLSDGSDVYNVELPGPTKVGAISLRDAEELAEKIVDAINEHTGSIWGVMYG